jgi:hypothetical protein
LEAQERPAGREANGHLKRKPRFAGLRPTADQHPITHIEQAGQERLVLSKIHEV